MSFKKKINNKKINQKQKKRGFFFSFFNFFYRKLSKYFSRLNIILFFIFFVYSYYVFTLYDLQIVNGEKYRKDVDLIATGKTQKTKIFNRGEIFFTNKKNEKIVAAGIKTKYNLIISPRDIKNSKKLFSEINNIVKIDKSKFDNFSKNKKSQYAVLKKDITSEQKDKIKKLKTIAVYVEEKTARFYPLKDIGSEVLGFVSIDGTDGIKKGMYGLEKQYEGVLSFSEDLKPNGIFKKIFTASHNFFSKKIVTDDGYIETTIDAEVQKKLEDVLKGIDSKYSSNFSSGIVIRPYSGEVVALATSKNFDLNKKPKDYRLIAVENRYEFGSIFKPLVIAIGLETGAITKDFSFNDKGYMILNKRRIQNYDGVGRGPGTNIYKIISQSLNTGVAAIALRIGTIKFVDYLNELGLSTETNIDLPGETFGDISNLNSGEDIELATASFGQGISLTTVGMVRAMAAIAAGGSIPDLHIVKKIVYRYDMSDMNFVNKRKRVFSSENANFVRDIMVKSADNVLKNGAYKRKFHKVAVKTGTAQIAKPTGGYYKNKYTHSFIGFFPATAPVKDRYLVFLFTNDPKGVQYSSQSLTKPFFEITDFIINYFDIKADRNKTY